jgi:predicted kinase
LSFGDCFDNDWMATVYLLIGVQGSGKSFWAAANARRLGAEVIASDAVRNELEAQGADASDGDRVFALVNERLKKTLAEGVNVILDSTHARRAWRKAEVATARRFGATLIGVWFDIPLDVCLKRNAARTGTRWGERAVPEEFLLEVARGFEGPMTGEFDEVWRITVNGFLERIERI